MADFPLIVETDWLNEHLKDPDVSIIDGSWYLPAMNRNGAEEFQNRHIPGAVHFDIDKVAEPGSSLPHTLASIDFFAKTVGQMGISDQDKIIVYDGMGLFSGPRVLWNFKVMGAKNVALLNGGLPKWVADGFDTESGTPAPALKTFNASLNNDAVITFDEMNILVSKGDVNIADARPNGRFLGAEPEPREGMRSGHMPGAYSVPVTNISKEGQMLPPETLRKIFSNAGIDLDGPIVTTCGSGVTAAALSLALETMGHKNHMLYDGSWSEWGGRDDTDVVVGTP